MQISKRGSIRGPLKKYFFMCISCRGERRMIWKGRQNLQHLSYVMMETGKSQIIRKKVNTRELKKTRTDARTSPVPYRLEQRNAYELGKVLCKTLSFFLSSKRCLHSPLFFCHSTISFDIPRQIPLPDMQSNGICRGLPNGHHLYHAQNSAKMLVKNMTSA